MNHYLILTFILILSGGRGFAQENIACGEQYSRGKEGDFFFASVNGEEHLTVCTYKKEGIILKRTDLLGNVLNSKELPYSYSTAAEMLRSITAFAGNIILMTERSSRSTHNDLFLRMWDQETFQPIGEGRKIASIKAHSDNKHATYTSVHISPGNTHLLIVFTDHDPNKDRPVYIFQVYNKSLDLVWTQELRSTHDAKDVTYKDFQVNDTGSCHFLMHKYDESWKTRVPKITVGYTMSSMDPAAFPHTYRLYVLNGDDAPKDVPIELAGLKDVRFRGISLNNEDEVVVGGIFASENNPDQRFMMAFEPISMDLLHTAIGPLPEGGYDRYRTNWKTSYKNSAEPFNDMVVSMLLGEDGGIYLMCEEIFRYQDPDRPSTVTENNDVHVFHFSNETLDWARTIPKRQRDVNGDASRSSYKCFSDGSDLIMLFNDDEKNLELTKEGLVELARIAHKTGVITQVKVSATGDILRSTLMPRPKGEAVVTNSMNSIGDRIFLVSTDQTNDFRFCHATVQ